MTLDPDLQRLADHADRLNADTVRALIARVQGYRDEAGRKPSWGNMDYRPAGDDPALDEPIAYYLKETAR